MSKPIKLIVKTIEGLFSHKTYLTAVMSAGVGALTVKDISGFAINQILLIGELGAEDSELIKTHAATAPTGSTITLASNLVYAHPIDTPITVLLYDQFELSHSTSIAGTKTTLTTGIAGGLVALPADETSLRYDDSQFTSGYYWIRYKNSIGTGTFSDYFGPIPYDGYAENTVGKIIKKAMKRCHLDDYTDYIDFDFCIEELNECLRYISGKLKRWSKLQTFDYVLGQTTRGVNKFTLPTNIAENENNKSIYNVRVGRNPALAFKRFDQWMDDIMSGMKHTQVTTQAVAGQVTLEIDNSYDFVDAGSVNLYIAGQIYTVTYTGVTRSATAGILTGIPASGTGSISITIPVDTEIWQGESEVTPKFYTVYGGYLYTELPSVTNLNQNVYCDYNRGPDSVNSEDDVLDTFRYDACLHYLIWTMNASLKNKGKKDMNDAEYTQFLQVVADYIRNEIPAHRKQKRPRRNGIFYNNRDRI